MHCWLFIVNFLTTGSFLYYCEAVGYFKKEAFIVALQSCWGLFAGMASRDFRGIPSIQEVECWAEKLGSDVKLMSLQMYKIPGSSVIASLNLYTNNCMTYGEFSSCFISPKDAHKSRLRLLVHDLGEGETRQYKCLVTGVTPSGGTKSLISTLTVTRASKWTFWV